MCNSLVSETALLCGNGSIASPGKTAETVLLVSVLEVVSEPNVALSCVGHQCVGEVRCCSLGGQLKSATGVLCRSYRITESPVCVSKFDETLAVDTGGRLS